MCVFAGEELERQNANVISGGRNGLINSYTREEIEVEFILNCLCAPSGVGAFRTGGLTNNFLISLKAFSASSIHLNFLVFFCKSLIGINNLRRTTEAHNIMATSVLEFISKISGRSDMYTTPGFRSRLGQLQT